MSWLSKVTGRDAARRNRRNERAAWGATGGSPEQRLRTATVEEAAGGGWQDAFAQTAGATINRALPRFQNQLQLTREDLVRRGVSTGDLGVSTEFDLTRQFSDSLSDTLGGMAMTGYENNRNRYLDLLTGHLDRDQAKKNAKMQMWSNILGGSLQAAGYAAGGM